MIAIVAATNLPLWPRCQISHFDRALQFGTFLLATCGLEGQRIWGGLGAAANMREGGQQIWPGSAVWCVEWNFPFCRPEHFPICCLLAPIFPPIVESLPTNSLLLYWAKVNVKRDVFFLPSSDLWTIAWGLLLCQVEQSLNEAAFREHWQKPKRYQ